MKKVLWIFLWLGLGVCMVLFFANGREKAALRQDRQALERKNNVLQTLYDQAKEEWEKNAEDLKAEYDALNEEFRALQAAHEELTQDQMALTDQLNAALSEAKALSQAEKEAQDALALAQAAWDEERLAMTAEKDEASRRLNEALAVLMPGIGEADAENGSLFDAPPEEEPTPAPEEAAEEAAEDAPAVPAEETPVSPSPSPAEE